MARTIRGTRDGKRHRPKQKRAEPAVATVAEIVTLPILGRVPMIRSAESGVRIIDPRHELKIPPGVILGDVSRQRYSYASFRYAYADETRTCQQCRVSFTFLAKEQKFWYEVLQFPFYSVAVRCVACRRQRRTDRAVAARYQASVPLQTSDDATELCEFAAALCDLHERLGTGRPDHVIAAARKARRVEPRWADPLYWESRGQALAGRDTVATELLGRFVEEALTERASRRLVDDARRRLAPPGSENTARPASTRRLNARSRKSWDD